MRELTIRLKFNSVCLGNKKASDGSGRFVFQRNPSTGSVLFMPTWHASNMRFAASVLGRHDDQVGKIHWDPDVDGLIDASNRWYRREYMSKQTVKPRYVLHEAFFPGHEIGINVCLPDTISQDDFIRLVSKAGQYKGLSPWKPGDYGRYDFVSLLDRQLPKMQDDGGCSQQETLHKKEKNLH